MYCSDGSANIYVLDGETMQVIDTIRVFDPVTNKSVRRINELEWVNGFIYANVWYKDILLKIDPNDGEIVQQWDLTPLMKAEKSYQTTKLGRYKGDCLNGIAYDPTTESFYLTGKEYHLVFKVKLISSNSDF